MPKNATEEFLSDEEDEVGAVPVKDAPGMTETTFGDDGKPVSDYTTGDKIEPEKRVDLDADIEESFQPEPQPETAPEDKKNRAEERIRELNARKREAELEAQREREKLRRVEAELRRFQVATAQNLVSQYTKDIENAERAMKKAFEEQDTDAFLKAQKAILEAQGNLAQVKPLAEQGISEENSERPLNSSATQRTSDLPQAAKEWMSGKEAIIDNVKYRELPADKRKHLFPLRQEVFSTANQLRSEGFDPEDPAFYEELDIRLSNKFDFYDRLASDGIDGVDFSSEGTKNPSGETKKPQQSAKRVVPVAASSPGASYNAPKPKVKISKAQQLHWESSLLPRHLRMGLTKEQSWEEYKKLVEEHGGEE